MTRCSSVLLRIIKCERSWGQQLSRLSRVVRLFRPPVRPTKPFDSLHSLEGVARLSFTARIERAHCYRARSASKKDIWLLPLFLLSATSRSSPHLRPLTDLPHGTPSHKASLSNSLATTP